jgi:hypothetical protein
VRLDQRIFRVGKEADGRTGPVAVIRSYVPHVPGSETEVLYQWEKSLQTTIWHGGQGNQAVSERRKNFLNASFKQHLALSFQKCSYLFSITFANSIEYKF